MSAESELLIKIRSALEGEGLDAAKTKLDSLISSTKSHTGASAEQNKALHDAQFSLQRVNMVATGLSQTMQGGAGSINGMITAARGLSNALGPLVAIAGSFIAGWKAGIPIQEALWKKIVEGAQSVDRPLIKTREEFDNLNKIKLDGLKGELSDIMSKLDQVLSSLGAVASQRRAEISARAESDVAGVEATMAPGPERERAIAEIRRASAEEINALETDAATKKRDAAIAAQAEADKRIAAAKAELDAAEARLAAAEQTGRERWSEGVSNLIKESRSAALSARETYGKEIEEMQGQSRRAQSVVTEQQSVLTVSGYEKQSIGARFQATSGDIARREEETRRRKAESDEKKEQEARLAELEQRKETLQSEQEQKTKVAGGEIETATGVARTARGRAESFDASKGKYRSGAARQAALEKDKALEQEALKSEAALAQLKAAREEMVDFFKKEVAELEKLKKQVRDQNKNLPLY